MEIHGTFGRKCLDTTDIASDIFLQNVVALYKVDTRLFFSFL